MFKIMLNHFVVRDECRAKLHVSVHFIMYTLYCWIVGANYHSRATPNVTQGRTHTTSVHKEQLFIETNEIFSIDHYKSVYLNKCMLWFLGIEVLCPHRPIYNWNASLKLPLCSHCYIFFPKKYSLGV